jgi:hypothetical protein
MIIFSSKTGGKTVKARNWDLLGFFSPIPGMLQAGFSKGRAPQTFRYPKVIQECHYKKNDDRPWDFYVPNFQPNPSGLN